MSEVNTTDILSARESRLAVVLFEIMKPQIGKMIDDKLDGFKASEINISDHTGEIEDIIYDWIQYNLSLTTTVD